MTAGRLVALCGLFLAWWGFQQEDGRAFAWALGIIAFSPLVRPLLGLDAGARDVDTAASEQPRPPQPQRRPEAEAGGGMPASRQRFKR